MFTVAFETRMLQRVLRDVKAVSEQQAYVIAHSIAKKNQWKVINFKRVR